MVCLKPHKMAELVFHSEIFNLIISAMLVGLLVIVGMSAGFVAGALAGQLVFFCLLSAHNCL